MLTTCPNCGQNLTAVDVTNEPTWAPWLCSTCSRGWWPAELTPAARRAWQPNTRDYADQLIMAAARADRDGAVAAFKARRG